MILDILEEHLDDAAGLYERIVTAPTMLDVTLEDVAELEQRLEASLAGLRLGGEETWGIARSYLEELDTGNTFVGALCAWELGETEGREAVAAAADGCERDARIGLRGGTARARSPNVDREVSRGMTEDSRDRRALFVGAGLDRGIPIPDAVLREALAGDPDPLLSVAIEAVAAQKHLGHRTAVEAWAGSSDALVAPASLEAIAAWDPGAAWSRAREYLRPGDPSLPEEVLISACRVAGVVGDSLVVEGLRGMLDSESYEVKREALLALGNSGCREALPVLLSASRNPELHQVAVVALERILGPCSAEALEPVEATDEEGWHPDHDLPRIAEDLLESWCRQTAGESPAKRARTPVYFEWLGRLSP